MHNACVQVTALFVYPVKSAAGMAVDTWDLDDFGLRHDREFMVVDETGSFLTQRDIPRLALVRPELADPLIIHTPEGSAEAGTGQTVTVRVWDYRGPAVDCGDEVADLLTLSLDRPCRLVRTAPRHMRAAPGGGQVGFADGFPLLITSTASLADLNRRLPEPLPMNRFRPNIVVDPDEPWVEDGWLELDIAGVPVDVIKPCTRCAITRVDQETGVRGDMEPLHTLAQFRRGPEGVEFGQNAIHRAPGRLRVGDAVTVTSPQW